MLLAMMAVCLGQSAWAAERNRAERPVTKPARGEHWPNAPWRNTEAKSPNQVEPRGQAGQAERTRETRREPIQPVSDSKSERQRLSPEARRELRQQIHEARKELYR